MPYSKQISVILAASYPVSVLREMTRLIDDNNVGVRPLPAVKKPADAAVPAGQATRRRGRRREP